MGDDSYYKIPEDQDLIANYFCCTALVETLRTLKKKLDYEYRTANIRVNIKSGMLLIVSS